MSGMKGVYKLENSISAGNGKFTKTGVGNSKEAKESIDIAYRYFVSNHNSFSSSISIKIIIILCKSQIYKDMDYLVI